MPARVRRDRYAYVITCDVCRQGERRRTHNGAHMLKARHNRWHAQQAAVPGILYRRPRRNVSRETLAAAG